MLHSSARLKVEQLIRLLILAYDRQIKATTAVALSAVLPKLACAYLQKDEKKIRIVFFFYD